MPSAAVEIDEQSSAEDVDGNGNAHVNVEKIDRSIRLK
jgi:hypothetical protein